MGNTLKHIKNEAVIGFQENNEITLQSVYTSVYPKVKTYVLRNSGNETLAKDIFQEAFIACWRNIKADKLSKNGNVEAYLYTIAKNKWIDYLRSSVYKKTKLTDQETELHIVEEETNDENEEANKIVLKKALETLNNSCKEVLELFYFERRSMDEISKKLNMTSASVRNQKYRCMNQLRNLALKFKSNG